jgi:hypothetical protein
MLNEAPPHRRLVEAADHLVIDAHALQHDYAKADQEEDAVVKWMGNALLHVATTDPNWTWLLPHARKAIATAERADAKADAAVTTWADQLKQAALHLRRLAEQTVEWVFARFQKVQRPARTESVRAAA